MSGGYRYPNLPPLPPQQQSEAALHAEVRMQLTAMMKLLEMLLQQQSTLQHQMDTILNIMRAAQDG